MAQLEFVPSSRGGRKALYNGFMYTKHRVTGTGSFWHCVDRHSKCKGRLKLNVDETTVINVTQHTHLRNFGTVKAERLVAAAKKRCLDEPHVIPSVVTRETYSAADNETLVVMPKESSVKATIRRMRRRQHPALPASLEDLQNIPEKYQNINGDR